ncbi:MAG: AzlD domain-containing protein [Alphaproteobacteria bacterium]
MAEHSIWLAILVGAAATYLWRGLGVALAGRIDPGGAVFRWTGCVAYALLAGLIARMIVLPLGALQELPLWARLAGAALALAAFYASRRNILIAAAAGVGAIIFFAWLGSG